MSVLSVLWLPAGLVVGAAYLAGTPEALPASVAGLLPWAPYGLAALGAVLAARFHQSRAVFAFVVLVFATAALAGGGTAGLAGRAAAVLVPLNLVAVAWLGEKGVLTPPGAFRLGLIGLQAAAVAWLALIADPALQAEARALLEYRIAPAAWGQASRLAQPALVAGSLAGAVFAARALIRRQPLDGGFLAVWAALMLAADGPASAVPLYAAAGAAGLSAAVVQESYRLAYVDELTGLPGRRALMTAMGALGGRYAVAMIDVDHFKKFNDTYGHDVGDQVLQMVAAHIGRVKGGGKGFRYGGEEFTVLFPGRTAEAAREHLEALRAAIEGAGFKLRAKDRPKAKPATKRKAARAKTVSVTVSIGVAEGDGARGTEAALKAADKNLYKAKKAGRNRLAG
jgi:diguanylate cyclase (GGDEF)-like protein